jgi:hypothetical protein
MIEQPNENSAGKSRLQLRIFSDLIRLPSSDRLAKLPDMASSLPVAASRHKAKILPDRPDGSD